MQVSALSDVGRIRKENEDRYLISAAKGLFAVADGMGGHAGGQIASSIAVRTLEEEIPARPFDADPAELLENALLKANQLILERGKEEEYYGMGTTVTTAFIIDKTLHIAHIGDSRAYLLRRKDLSLLTQDHSLVNELFQQGSLTAQEALNHPQRNILTRALGTQSAPQLDVFSCPLLPGDFLLLCTDGLYNMITDVEIQQELLTTGTLDDKVGVMVRLALERGGNDNVTVLLIQV